MGSDKDTIEHVLSPLLSALNSAAPPMPHILSKWSSEDNSQTTDRSNSVSPDTCPTADRRPRRSISSPANSMFSMDYQSLSSESEMSIMMKNSTDSINERSETSLSLTDFSPSGKSHPRSRTPQFSSSTPPTPFTPADLTIMIKQNITPAELSDRSLELLKSMELFKKTYTVVMKDSGAEIETSLPGYLLDGDTIVMFEKKANVIQHKGNQ